MVICQYNELTVSLECFVSILQADISVATCVLLWVVPMHVVPAGSLVEFFEFQLPNLDSCHLHYYPYLAPRRLGKAWGGCTPTGKRSNDNEQQESTCSPTEERGGKKLIVRSDGYSVSRAVYGVQLSPDPPPYPTFSSLPAIYRAPLIHRSNS